MYTRESGLGTKVDDRGEGIRDGSDTSGVTTDDAMV